jgi:hypothetical protein
MDIAETRRLRESSVVVALFCLISLIGGADQLL